MGHRVERFLTVLLTLSALVIAAILVRRELWEGSAAQSRAASDRQGLTLEPEWQSAFDVGVVLGEPAAPVQIVEFMDLECPACRDFETRTMAAVREQYGDRLNVVYVHIPLPYHRFARIGAQAAECALAQDRFTEFVSLVYLRQDSLGVKPWSAFAHEAGVADTMAFVRCLEDEPEHARIESGLEFGRRLPVRGTPTVIVNGWRFETSPSLGDLTRTIDELLQGRRPTLAMPD